MVFEMLGPELAEVPEALVIPLGEAPEGCLSALASAGTIGMDRCLLGFPHPSGANGHRKRQLELSLDMQKAKASSWFAKTAGQQTHQRAVVTA